MNIQLPNQGDQNIALAMQAQEQRAAHLLTQASMLFTNVLMRCYSSYRIKPANEWPFALCYEQARRDARNFIILHYGAKLGEVLLEKIDQAPQPEESDREEGNSESTAD